MKALTLWQPWASLVALGVKTIETRSWSTSYRGPLAIHAAKRKAKFGDMKSLIGHQLDAWAAWYGAGLVGADGSCDQMPYGAVVATCTLVDCLPTEQIGWAGRGGTVYGSHRGWLVPSEDLGHGSVYVSDLQRPYGDYTEGRYAWLLANIEALTEPVPARGRQGLWEWSP